jgi:glycosyltransferase involved in cell wall biosynthesis
LTLAWLGAASAERRMESATPILHETFAHQMPATPSVDVLIPTYGRAAALAVTLTALTAQTFRDFRVVISDQHESADAASAGEVQAVLRVLEARGHHVEIHKHLPRRGMAEQRQFLLDRAEARYVLFLDDDVIVESDLLERLVTTLQQTGCGFVGSAVIGLSYARDIRPHQQQIEFWEGDVTPEQIRPGMPEWDRHLLHNAANLYHVAGQLGLTATNARIYRVAWVGGCVLYDRDKLRACGAFGFWRQLPSEHCGEEVLAQQRVMARFGGCGLIPSGAYHQELPTTVPRRDIDAPKVLDLGAALDAC